MPLTGHPIFKVGTSNTPRALRRPEEENTMPQAIIKKVSPSPRLEDEEEVPSSLPTMPLEGTSSNSEPTVSTGANSDAPILNKTTSNTATKYTPPQYQPPSNTTELPPSQPASPLPYTTEDQIQAEEEHETPLLPLIAEVNNESTPRNTGAFILLWIVAIVLAPLAVAMVYAAYCIILEFNLERWLAVMPNIPFLSK